MATITQTDMTGTGARDISVTTLAGSDDFEYGGGTAILILSNGTGGDVTPTVEGDGATTASLPGYGTVDVSGGYSVGTISDGTTVAIPLDSIRKYLVGNLTVESGSGLEAQLLVY